MDTLALAPVDELEVLIVVDNFVDVLLPSDEVARRMPLRVDFWEREHLRAEHGYALLVTATAGDRTSTVLYDAGLGRDTLLHNLDVLEARPADLRAILLSHGHADHHGGLEGVARRLTARRLPLVLHPDAWHERRVVFPTGVELPMPPPSRADLESVAVDIVEERGPSLLVDDRVLLTGQVQRTTDFEKGFPLQQVHTPAGWEPDPWIWDDQAVVVNVRGKGPRRAVELQPRRHRQRAAPRPAAHRRRPHPRRGRRAPPHRRLVRRHHPGHGRGAHRDGAGLDRARPLHRLAGRAGGGSRTA